MKRNGFIQFGRTRIDYLIETRPARKTVLVTVDPVDGVVLFVPPKTSSSQLERIVQKRATWILNSLAEFRRAFKPPVRRYVSGEAYSYLGRRYTLEVVSRGGQKSGFATLERGRLVVTISKEGGSYLRAVQVRAALSEWYRRRAEIQLAKRVRKFAKEVGVPPPSLLIRDQLKRWGSCDRKGTVRLNWRIVMAPTAIVDYLCAHEVCHLVQPDHSLAYWRLLESLMPDYGRRREQLRVYGPLLNLPSVVEKTS